MRRIIIINHANPFAKGGGSYASRAYMKAFAEWAEGGADICLDAESPFVEDPTILAAKYIKVVKRSFFKRALSLINGDIQRYTSFIKKHLSKGQYNYEWAVVSGAAEGGALVDYFHSYGIKVVTIHHNYEPEYIYGNTSIPILKSLLKYHSYNLQKKAYRESDINLFLTNEDAQRCEREYGVNTAANKIIGVFEFNKIPPLPHSTKNESPVFIITGQLDNAQGIDGVEYFFHELFTYIPQKCKVIISGRNPSKSIRELCSRYNNVQLIPNPDDMRPVISAGDFYICPTRVGGGLKLRVLDGLKQGLPAIVHKCSSRGYDVYNDSRFFKVFENPEQFKTCVEDFGAMFQANEIDKKSIYETYIDSFSYEVGLNRVREIMSSFDEMVLEKNVE